MQKMVTKMALIHNKQGMFNLQMLMVLLDMIALFYLLRILLMLIKIQGLHLMAIQIKNYKYLKK